MRLSHNLQITTNKWSCNFFFSDDSLNFTMLLQKLIYPNLKSSVTHCGRADREKQLGLFVV